MNTTDFAPRLVLLQDAVDDFGNELSKVFWREFDRAGYRRRGRFVETVINGIIDKSGMDQQHIAQGLGVSNGALCEWKKGRINPRQIDRLQAYARYVIRVRVPPLPDIPADVAEAASAMVQTMQRFRELLQERPVTPLDDVVYACVREAAGCPAWLRARIRCDQVEAVRIAADLLRRAGVDRPPQWFQAVVDEWWPLFMVCVDHIRSGHLIRGNE